MTGLDDHGFDVLPSSVVLRQIHGCISCMDQDRVWHCHDHENSCYESGHGFMPYCGFSTGYPSTYIQSLRRAGM